MQLPIYCHFTIIVSVWQSVKPSNYLFSKSVSYWKNLKTDVRKIQCSLLTSQKMPVTSLKCTPTTNSQLCTSCWSYLNSRTQKKETEDDKQNPNILVHQHHTLVKLFVSLCKSEATELADIFLHLRVLQQTYKSVWTCYGFMVPGDLDQSQIRTL